MRYSMTIATIFTAATLLPASVLANSSDKLMQAAFEVPSGQIALVILTIIFMPLITYTAVKEKTAELNAHKDLTFMAGYSPLFSWRGIEARAKHCFHKVHTARGSQNFSGVRDLMTDWCWHNQQGIHREIYKIQNLVNICEVHKITHLKPLLFVHKNDPGKHESSMVVISMTAEVKDFLKDKTTGNIVEGSKRFKVVETVWSFVIEGGQWKVLDIEESGMSPAYVRAAKELPDIKSTLISNFRV